MVVKAGGSRNGNAAPAAAAAAAVLGVFFAPVGRVCGGRFSYRGQRSAAAAVSYRPPSR